MGLWTGRSAQEIRQELQRARARARVRHTGKATGISPGPGVGGRGDGGGGVAANVTADARLALGLRVDGGREGGGEGGRPVGGAGGVDVDLQTQRRRVSRCRKGNGNGHMRERASARERRRGVEIGRNTGMSSCWKVRMSCGAHVGSVGSAPVCTPARRSLGSSRCAVAPRARPAPPPCTHVGRPRRVLQPLRPRAARCRAEHAAHALHLEARSSAAHAPRSGPGKPRHPDRRRPATATWNILCCCVWLPELFRFYIDLASRSGVHAKRL